jgi:hypothetical protein
MAINFSLQAFEIKYDLFSMNFYVSIYMLIYRFAGRKTTRLATIIAVDL